ncbi:DNA-formamidopyrimidine glycosylase [Streptococcaceae bacterium ESL0687]|nr:DNA-formamidopyrimidine glycosylase [Streptococcaceae bacterium ESL0687]
MPELPEVENVRRGLERLVKGKKITSVEVAYPRMVLTGAEEFEQALLGQVVESVGRRGKYLILKLSNDVVISHLRMEGKYNLYQGEVPSNKHYHVFIGFDDGSTLVYQDVRKFGTMELMKEQALDGYFISKKIGPEPTQTDFDLADFYQSLHKSKKIIKPYLLDQTLVAGLGNIYVDEVLWLAKIFPGDPANLIPYEKIAVLRDAIIDVLEDSIASGGSSIRTYKNALGDKGSYQDKLRVYGKVGVPCPRCGTPIEKFKLSGRGTHFCPYCQPSLKEGDLND